MKRRAKSASNTQRIHGHRRPSPRKRNDVSRPSGAISSPYSLPEPWAFAQFDDPAYGSWGVVVDRLDGGVAKTYRYDGLMWQPVGTSIWVVDRGRLSGGPLPPSVRSGLSRAVLELDAPRSELKHAFRSTLPKAFASWEAVPDKMSPRVETIVRLAGQWRCAADYAADRQFRSKARQEADRKAETQREIVRAALAETCGDGSVPVEEGSDCDVALSIIGRAARVHSCEMKPPLCTHRVTDATLRRWRSSGMPPIGPYETQREHTIGSDPCCFYHPATQERLRLRRKTVLHIEAPEGSPQWVAAVREAEAGAPEHLTAIWQRCDDMMRRKVGVVREVSGGGSEGAFRLLQAFHDAVIRGDFDAAANHYQALRPMVGSLPPMEEFAQLDAGFWDLAVSEARDLDNPGFKRWVQVHGGRRGRRVFQRVASAR